MPRIKSNISLTNTPLYRSCQGFFLRLPRRVLLSSLSACRSKLLNASVYLQSGNSEHPRKTPNFPFFFISIPFFFLLSLLTQAGQSSPTACWIKSRCSLINFRFLPTGYGFLMSSIFQDDLLNNKYEREHFLDLSGFCVYLASFNRLGTDFFSSLRSLACRKDLTSTRITKIATPVEEKRRLLYTIPLNGITIFTLSILPIAYN